MLVLEIEYLQGVSYAAKYNRPDEPEWPPHPDRVFMALVDAWGASGRSDAGADALRWLESQGPPEIAAPEASPRSRFKNFVPTSSNEAQGLGYLDASNLLQITQSIVRKERVFPAMALPDDGPTVHMIWRDAAPSAAVRDSLGALAGLVSHVGHSASLTRVYVAAKSDVEPSYVAGKGGGAGGMLLRCPHPGRFEALVSEFSRASSVMIPSWPSAAPTCRYGRPQVEPAEGLMGPGEEWVVLEAVGMVPVLRAFPMVGKAMRDAAMSHAEAAGKPSSGHDPSGPDSPAVASPLTAVHKTISGHDPSGGPLEEPHLAVLPMANVGWGRYSDGELLGVALVLPRASAYGTPERRQLRHAVSRFLDQKYGRGVLRLGRFGTVSLKRSAGGKKSLLPDRYTGVDRTWASVTPVILDKHPKKRHAAEDIVAEGCVRAGLPRPSSVTISRHSSVPGAPPAFVNKNARVSWLPPKPGMFDNRFVCHAVLTFESDVRGPVLVGAGRYYGMGLFLPSREIVA